MNDSLILGIETSGIVCSVAWWQDDKILLEYNIEKRNAHVGQWWKQNCSDHLQIPMIQAL